MTTTKEPHYRLFEEHSIDDIADKTGWALATVTYIKTGVRLPSRVFMRFAAMAYGETKEHLFEKLEVKDDES